MPDYGFNTVNLHNITLSINAGNAAGIACYKSWLHINCLQARVGVLALSTHRRDI